MLISGLLVAFIACGVHGVIFPPEVNDFLNNDSFKNSDAKLWVLIVAGSNGFYNYRHQSDAYHAYQIMKHHGLPDSQIVLMHYDDIAHNSENPTPGIVINHPNGSDVYKGVLKDYTGDSVTPQNFLQILTGNATSMKGISSGKVIASGPNDHVFVNFVDHGGPGIVAFANDELAATDLNNAIIWMYQQKKYAKLLLYFEACESGSMFDQLLPKNINAFATTASNPDESSYACYYDDYRGTYLGDVYSVNWMEDSDQENLQKETLQDQFKLVKKETNTSHVMEYGDLTMGTLKISEFMGNANPKPIVVPPASKVDAIPQEQVYMTLLKKRVEKAKTPEEKSHWNAEVEKTTQRRAFLMDTLKKIASKVVGDSARLDSLFRTRRPLRGNPHACLDAANKFFSKRCFSLAKNEYALFNAPRVFANLCMEGTSAELLIEAMDAICVHQTMVGIH